MLHQPQQQPATAVAHGRKACVALQQFSTVEATSSVIHSVPKKLPQPSPARLARATSTSEQSVRESTYFYLAYGSNLCAETFRGVRGIKPLSAINVHVPSLDLTFSLPGIPYTEPCFANTRYRKTTVSDTDYHKDRWHKGLVGVVYEVTPEDYHHIIATEGGGAGYADVVVPCFAIPPGTKTIEGEPVGTHFYAHTLLAPAGDDNNHAPFKRPDPSYAQASARYLKLIMDGAEEHELPADYRAFLQSLRPYIISGLRQKLGRALIMVTWVPLLLLFRSLGAALADRNGKYPAWLIVLMGLFFRTMWNIYDMALKKIFGDGERSLSDIDGRWENLSSLWLEKVKTIDRPTIEAKV